MDKNIQMSSFFSSFSSISFPIDFIVIMIEESTPSPTSICPSTPH